MQNEELRRAQVELETSRAQYLDLYELAPVGYLTLSEQGLILKANLTAATMLGTPRDKLVQRPLTRFILPEDKNIYYQRRKELFETGASQTFELRMLRADAPPFWALLDAVVAQEDDHSPVCRVAINDISERKRAEEALRKSEEKYRTLMETTNEAIIITQDEALKFANSKARRLFGYSLEEAVGRPFVEFIHPDDRLHMAERYRERLDGEVPEVMYPFRTIHKDGSIRWAEINSVLISWEDRPAIVSYVSDVTERKRAEKALRISEGQKDAILNGITANVAFVDKDLRLLWVNAAAAKSVNKSPAEMIGQTCYAFWADPAKPCQNCPTLKAFQTKQTEHALMYTPDGKVWDERGEPVFDERGDTIGVVEIAQDVTERKQAEDLLQQTRQNYEAFFNTIDDFLFVLDEQGNIIHTNTTVTDRLGYTNEELSGKSVLMVHPPERRAEAGRIVGEMLSGAVEFCPVPIVTKSGVQIPVETRVSHGFWDGKAVIFGVTKDISKVKLSEEKFSKLFHINPSACGLSDLSNRQYIEVNEAFDTLLGFQKDEVIGKTATELGILTPGAIKTILLNADSNGNVSNAEADLRAKNGDIKHVLLSSENIHVQEKKYRFTVVHDITARKQAEEALRESEARHSSMVANISDVIGIIGVDGMMKYKSPNISKWFGWEPQDLVGTDGWLTVHPDDLERIQKEFFTLLEKDNTVTTVEYRYKCKDGTYKRIELTAANLINNPAICGVLLNYHDITGRKQAEDALRESEETLRSQIENSFDVIFTLNQEGDFLFVSPAWERHFGYPVSDVVGRSFAPLVHPDDSAPLSEYLKRVLSTGQSETSPAYRVKHADGSWRSFIANGTTYFDAKGERRFIGVGHDITESKRAEEALRESEERFRMLLHSTGEAIYGLDMQGKCTFANAACCRILGYGSPEFFIGKNMHDLIHHSHKDGTSFAVADCLIFNAFRKGQKTHVDDEVLWKADGTSFPAEYWSYPILREGIIEGAVVTFIDITERKQLEERIRQIRSDLLFAVSHDLKSPLQALKQTQEMLSVLQPGEGLARFQEYSEIWRRNLQRLERMINNL
ncbi:MAG: PAS domain S-box protein, partial [Dehalococcoidia bacterium]